MDFSSDTSAPAHPAVIDALAGVNAENAPSYGGDDATARVKTLLETIFETELEIWLCASGTASNALALSCFCPPTGAILCHEEAHIERDERGAPEFFTGGGKLHLLPGSGGKIDEHALRSALGAIDHGFVHETPAHVLSLTNLTECGTSHSCDETSLRAHLAKQYDLCIHLDGARLANALAHTGSTPAELTWKSGVDVLTLGLTKTGAIGCEIIILFGEARAKITELQARAKRSGHMPPKMRYLAAQAEALLAGGLWLELAAHANQMARQLANMLCAIPGTTLAYPTDGNEVFVHLPEGCAEKLQAAGTRFYPWPGGSHRFVCSWSTTQREIDAFAETLRTLS